MSEASQNGATTFKVESAFQLKNRNFYLLGLIISGTVKIGMKAHLGMIGINKHVQILDIGLTTTEAIGLGFESLSFTEQEKEYLKTKSPFETKILIE